MSPVSAAGLLFHTSAVQKETTWSSWALDLSTHSLLARALMRYHGMRLIAEPLSFCSGLPSVSHGSDLEWLPPSLVSPEDQLWAEPSAKAQCGLRWISGSSLLLPLPQILALIPGSSEIRASLPIDLSRAKFSPRWED